MAIQKEVSQFCVRTLCGAYEKNNCGWNFSFIKIYGTIVIVYVEECERIIRIKANCCCLSQIVKGSTRNCANNKELI